MQGARGARRLRGVPAVRRRSGRHHARPRASPNRLRRLGLTTQLLPSGVCRRYDRCTSLICTGAGGKIVTLDERNRLQLAEAAKRLLGDDEGITLMELLP